jgi:hypothetical protein
MSRKLRCTPPRPRPRVLYSAGGLAPPPPSLPASRRRRCRRCRLQLIIWRCTACSLGPGGSEGALTHVAQAPLHTSPPPPPRTGKRRWAGAPASLPARITPPPLPPLQTAVDDLAVHCLQPGGSEGAVTHAGQAPLHTSPPPPPRTGQRRCAGAPPSLPARITPPPLLPLQTA